jgi:hypothetical protein
MRESCDPTLAAKNAAGWGTRDISLIVKML